ncbi:probable carbohydrate esterase At4g34215 [Euphorbia lathyris]|uniref:probable carbohydrate esterase At4g34215 n=1 Tax=Euphorbia lathyris TaxID=212925 RepID=UPI0033131290
MQTEQISVSIPTHKQTPHHTTPPHSLCLRFSILLQNPQIPLSLSLCGDNNMAISCRFWFLLVILTSQTQNCILANSHLPNDIFILGGQSNMAGRGGIDNDKWNGYIPPQCRSSPSILRLTAQLKWEIAHEPLDADIDVGKTCGVGPGMAFANELKAIDRRIGVVGLVPCAVGGTKIRQWGRGMKLYQDLVKRANESVRHGGRIRGVLWCQGESDTVRREDAQSYKGKLEKFFSDLRFDLNIPSLPVIQVAIGAGEGKYVEMVRRAQLGIRLGNVKCIDAKGLPLKNDHLHLTTTSEVKLGCMFAHAYFSSFPQLSH